MVATPNLAKRLKLDVNTGTIGAPVWTTVGALTNLAEAQSYTTQDTSTYDTGNLGSDMPTQYKKTLTGSVLRKKDVGVEDAGQLVLRNAGTTLTSLQVRWYDRNGGAESFIGTAYVQWEPQGGDATSLETANFTLMIQDIATNTNPVGAAGVPVILSILPSGQGAGQSVVITGSNFTGLIAVSGVKFNAVNATSFALINDNTITAVLPAGSAGVTPVLVTNAIGVSAAFSYTRAT